MDIRRIKTCPNCKSKPKFKTKKIDGGLYYKIQCKHCKLEQFGFFNNKEKAVIAWNDRTNPSPLWRLS